MKPWLILSRQAMWGHHVTFVLTSRQEMLRKTQNFTTAIMTLDTARGTKNAAGSMADGETSD